MKRSKKILVINIGSASKKYAFYKGKKIIFFSHLEKENGGFVVNRKWKNEKEREREEKKKISSGYFEEATKREINFLKLNNLIKDEKEISAVSFRVVCPGDFFAASVKIIDKKYISNLKKGLQSAPLHLGPTLKEIEKFKLNFPSILAIGISDSFFYSGLPKCQKYYGLPKNLAEKYGIKRFGYHGISASYIVKKIKKVLGYMPARLIICHLGGGASVVAVKNGKPFSASMGFTPLEGLVMTTRSGDVDFGAVSYLAQKEKLSFAQISELLNKKSGLLGLAQTDDMREIIIRRKRGDKTAKLAFDIFISRVQKYIGAYIFEMRGLDCLVFTATMGERSDIVREAVLKDAQDLGIILDKKKNKQITINNSEGFVENKKSKIKIAVLKTDEMEEMAREAGKIIN